jgi:F5/8 type C domain
MQSRTAIGLWGFAASVLLAMGSAKPALATITTNGNGGTTDVGIWYEPLYSLNPPGPYNQWNGNGSYINNLPLVNWTTVSGSPSYRSGYYEIYDSSNATVIADDMASMAAAKIDFVLIDVTNGGLGGVESQNNWTATYSGDIMTGAANWNANNSWKIRVAFAVGDYQGGSQSADGADLEAQAQAVYTTYENSSTYGTPSNWYQINGKPLLVIYYALSPSQLASYCASNDCTYINKFQIEYANYQGAGQWGWNLTPSGTQVDPAGLVAEVTPGWKVDNAGQQLDPRNDGTFYQNNWNVVFNNTYPRIVLLAAFNDWSEQMGLWINDTAASPYSPSPGYNMSGAVRPLEVWTLPDENITLDGYWNYTISAICYLRNGTSTACAGGTSPKPAWPHASANLALGATVSVSSSIGSLPASNVNDGNASTVWSSQVDGSPNSTEWVQLHMPNNPAFNTVILMGRGDIPVCFPVTFQIQVWNGSQWLTRVQETNFPQPVIAGQPIAFTWGSIDQTTDVRVIATQLGNDGAGGNYFQLGEFQVALEGNTPTVPVFANWGFESPAQGGTGTSGNSFTYGPLTNGWTFNSTSGVQQAGSAWNSYSPPQGLQTAFLQNSTSSFSQSLNFPAGKYNIRFLASQRTTVGSAQAINVYFDSTQILSESSIPATWTPYVTSSFTSSGGSHTVTFNGLNSGDNTAFIDEVQIFSQSPNLLANSSWSTGSLSSWTVAVGSGSSSDAYLTSGTGLNGQPYLLNINSTTSSFAIAVYQTVTGQPSGQGFTASVFAQTSGSTSGAYVRVQDGTGGTQLCNTNIPSGVSTWTQYSCSGTVPSDGQLTVSVGSDSSVNDWAHFDSASLTVQ